jgi:hypothetical protein
VFSSTLICGACVGVEVGSTVADGVSVAIFVGVGGMGVSVTGASIGSGSVVSVLDTPCPTWLQALNKMPSAVMSMKTRSFDFSKAKTLRAIFKKIAHLILHRRASYTTYFKLWFTVDPEDVDSSRPGT